MGMYAQLHLHEGDDVKFEATVMPSGRIDLAFTHKEGYLNDLAVTMPLSEAIKLRNELSKVIQMSATGAGNGNR